MGIKASNLSREELVHQLQLTVGELPLATEIEGRAKHYMNRATGTYFCSLGDDIKSDYVQALVYFEDVIPVLEKSLSIEDKKKAKYCYAAVSALRRMMGIY